MNWNDLTALPDEEKIPFSTISEMLNGIDPAVFLTNAFGRGMLYEECTPSEMQRYLSEFHGGAPLVQTFFRKAESISRYLGKPKNWSHLFVSKRDVFTLREELEVEEPTRPLSSKREQTLLKLIGALIATRYTGSAYKKSNGPNVSKIADTLHEDMAKTGIGEQGLSNKTLRELIPQALTAINENRED